ncbi:MAG: hypothetical protein JSW65_03150 [Candidatus Bipolaricaulota bacterium]|nr:MAG: hypothetical protein JSW65_03150 [Candidatus Bipolaricaulota bacterium]
MRNRLLILAVALTVSAAMPWVVAGAQFGLGGFGHVWGQYENGPYGLLDEFSVTMGPLVSFTDGAVRWDLWYGFDPVQAGWIADAPTPLADRSLNVWLDELGWRLWYGEPLSVTAGYSRLHCEALPVPTEPYYAAGEWFAHHLTAGLGVRVGGFWVLAEVGLRWWNWLDVPAAPDLASEFGVYYASGLTVPLNAAGALPGREPLEALPVTIEESFPVDCGDWSWHGQVGRIENLDGELHLFIEDEEQRLMQQFACGLGRFALDVEITPHVSYTDQYYQGVILRYQDDDNFFAVDLRADGYVRFVKVVEGVWETVRGWRRAIGYRTGARNRLRIIAPGNRFVVYLNGHRILTAREVSFRKGDVALFAGTQDGRGHSVSFDNLSIREIPPGTVLDPRTVAAQEVELAIRTASVLALGAGSVIGFMEEREPIGFAFAAAALYALFGDSTHILHVE